MALVNKELRNKILTPNSGISSMRYVMLKIVDLLQISAYAIVLLIVYKTITKQIIDWSGIATFIGAWATIILATLGSKAYQKTSETKNKEI